MKGLDPTSATVRRRASVWFICLGLAVVSSPASMAQQWASYGRDAQHNALAAGPSQLPTAIRWSTPVDLAPQYSGNGDLYIHYGSPAITSANTILVPVKTGAAGGFQVNGFNARTGNRLWSVTTDYVLPSHNWTPPLGITLTPGDGAVAIPAAGGTVLVRKNPNSHQGSVGRVAFFGIKNYNMNPGEFDSAIHICTPITCDGFGNLYFGYVSSGDPLPNYPQGIPSGLARVTLGGTGSFVAAAALCNDANIQKVVYNCAPALSSDGTKLYVAVNQSSFSSGYLCLVESQTLKPRRTILLNDPRNAQGTASLPDDGTATPTVGPDGDVYFGVLEANFPSNHARGWLLHFNAGLTAVKTPGAFGWDDSASIVPRALVPSYKGRSTYLILTKYNNYADAGIGGNGMNKVAVLDPNTSMSDPISGATVMNEVLTILGPTQNTNLPGVNEWCINSAAIDTANKCAVVNSEDGHVYRWDFTTNTLSPGLYLAPPTGEAYTSTLIGPDGAVYAINNARLFCCVAPNSTNTTIPPNTPMIRSSFFKGLSRFFPSGLQGAAWIGILAALSVHLGIRASSRLRTALGSFLS